MITPGYFETTGIPGVAGRDFANEGAAAPKVVVVNEAFVRLFFKNEKALARRVASDGRTDQISLNSEIRKQTDPLEWLAEGSGSGEGF